MLKQKSQAIVLLGFFAFVGTGGEENCSEGEIAPVLKEVEKVLTGFHLFDGLRQRVANFGQISAQLGFGLEEGFVEFLFVLIVRICGFVESE